MALDPKKDGKLSPKTTVEPNRSAPPAEQFQPQKAGQLAQTDRFTHARLKALGSDGPSVGDALEHAEEFESLSQPLLPSAKAYGHPDLPESRFRPPEFLTPAEAMKAVYLEVKGRASPKTITLLESEELSQMLMMLRQIYESRAYLRAEARICSALYRRFQKDPGPILLGLGDPRITELWRVFLDGWEIWQGQDSEYSAELFWEGEVEDGPKTSYLMQSLLSVLNENTYQQEIILKTVFNEQCCTLVYDGTDFYRQLSENPQ